MSEVAFPADAVPAKGQVRRPESILPVMDTMQLAKSGF